MRPAQFVGQGRAVGGQERLAASDTVPNALYLPDGLVVPVCVVSLEQGPRPAPPAADLGFAPGLLGGGYPVVVRAQGRDRVGSIGCPVTDGHLVDALTNRHVVGTPGTPVYTEIDGQRVEIGQASEKHLTKAPFTEVYPSLPGQRVLVNLDVGLIEVSDLDQWTAQLYGIGQMGPLADLNDANTNHFANVDKPRRSPGSNGTTLLQEFAAGQFDVSVASFVAYYEDAGSSPPAGCRRRTGRDRRRRPRRRCSGPGHPPYW